MKKSWRWPLAGFVLGGLVGATILTVNVVGASSPEPEGVTVSSFGEVLHTPPLLAEAGQPVELSYDVVCGPDEGRARRDVLAEGLGLRPRVRGGRLRRAPVGAGARRASVGRGLGRQTEDSTTTPSSTTAAARRRRSRRRPPMPRSMSGRSRAGRRSTWDRSPSERRDRPRRSSRSSPGARAARRSGSTAARSSRGSGRRHSTSLPTAPSSCSTR